MTLFHADGRVHCALFSRSGFTPGLQALARHEALSLFSLDEIVAASRWAAPPDPNLRPCGG